MRSTLFMHSTLLLGQWKIHRRFQRRPELAVLLAQTIILSL
jgi:hypothetical protein